MYKRGLTGEAVTGPEGSGILDRTTARQLLSTGLWGPIEKGCVRAVVERASDRGLIAREICELFLHRIFRSVHL